MIKLNNFYNAKELALALNISERTFRYRKQEIELFLDAHYEWEYLPEGKYHYYYFTKCFDDVAPVFKHRKSTDDNIGLYKNIVMDQWKDNPLFTINSLANSIQDNYSIATRRRYINIALDQLHAVKAPYSVLCYYENNKYTPVEKEVLNKYLSILKAEQAVINKKSIEEDWAPEEIDKALKKAFIGALSKTSDIYNIYVRWVKPLELGAY